MSTQPIQSHDVFVDCIVNDQSTPRVAAAVFQTSAPVSVLTNPNDTAMYGGKAVGLRRLQALGLDVPKFWVIPCSASITRPKINLSFLNSLGEDVKYSVRSGAPISMPGILNTKLNVSKWDILKCIEDVWDSWNSDHAKQYREDHGIDHNMGTAVIIQQMIDPEVSGVAFTADVNFPKAKILFQPKIEYVEGTGDSLVDGQTIPTEFKTPTSTTPYRYRRLYSELMKALRLIHDSYGASDVEWCMEKGTGDLYLLQQRALKFTGGDGFVTIEIPGTVVAQGAPIGAPVYVEGDVKHASTSSNPEDFAGKIIRMDGFSSSDYIKMTKAAGIITSYGGHTCHAAIVARDLGKPCVSGITGPLHTKSVVLDGITGKIVKPEKGFKLSDTAVPKPVTSKKLTHIQLRKRLPFFLFVSDETDYDVSRLLVKFYYTLFQHEVGKYSEVERDWIVSQIASVLCTYFYCATLCEARHFKVHADYEDFEARKELADWLNKHAGLVGGINAYGRTRTAVKLKYVRSHKEVVKIVEKVKDCFNNFSWTPSFGGKKWGEITNHLLSYLKGELTDTLFVDGCFNLQHNTGCAFGKFDWCRPHYGSTFLTQLLDTKQKKGMQALLDMAENQLGTINLQNILSSSNIINDELIPTWEKRYLKYEYSPQPAESNEYDESNSVEEEEEKEGGSSSGSTANAETKSKIRAFFKNKKTLTAEITIGQPILGS